ncbi:MAG TPA: NAD(P)/FAD-dependent oxidoreductase [Gaiellaceae bacterium]|nr:NAD(P)/FAD-dependent oxidoreductase [Gaiellaceae bacterium]
MAGQRIVVLGAGSSGEHFVGALRRLDSTAEIVVVERELAGGDCSYYACIPTKTLLRPTEALAAARLAPGAAEAITGEIDVERVLWWRDQVTDGRDDSWHVGWLAEQGAELVRGDARVARPGVIEVGDRELEYDQLVVATGSESAVPGVEGLAELDFWTNREAVWAGEIPGSVVVLGVGAVGAELGQFYRRMGADVTLVEYHDRILARVDPDAGALLRERFEEEGIRVLVGRSTARAEKAGGRFRLHFESGETVEGDRLLVATGRRPNVFGIGLEQLGIEITDRGITVDDRLRAGAGVWALGDVAGVGLLTHLGKYQARVAAANVAGQDVRADYRAIPAAVFTDPQVATVGTMEGDGIVTARYEIAGGRLSTYERPRRPGFVKLAADPARRVLVGAVAVGPEAGEWLGQLTLAVRAEVPIDVLLDTIQPYPTFSEAIFNAALELDERLM